LEGANEIGFAILATTISLVAVFVPVGFLTGKVGRLFNEFGISVAVSVLISGFVALTLTPMLCSRVLRRTGGHAADADEGAHGAGAAAAAAGGNWFDRLFARFAAWYEQLLRRSIRHRMALMIVTGLVIVSIF